MIDDKLREQLSALFDGQLPAEERSAVETRIQNDPEVRAEWEALRQFAGAISATAPSTVQAPPDFRARILNQLQGASQSPNRARASNPAAKFAGRLTGFAGYLVAGAVLAALAGTMIYLDYRQSHKATHKPAAPVDLSVLGTPEARKTAPEYRGTPVSVSEGDIQGRAEVQPTPVVVLDLKGGVYTLGQGKAQRTGGVVSHPWDPGSREPAGEITLVAAGQSPISLETSSDWTLDRINRRLLLLNISSVSGPRVLSLAQENHLNPGLLCAALHDFPNRAAEELALDLRLSLNTSTRLSEDARLQKCVQALGGKPGAAAKWKKLLRP
jgi:anti-sigma-K factor RskA